MSRECTAPLDWHSLGRRGSVWLLSTFCWWSSFRRLVFLGCVAGCASFTFTTVGRRPERQVVSKQLHDESAVTVGLLRERVELSNGIVESLLGEVACAVRRIQDLVVEDTEVERETKTDGMCWGEFGLCNVGGILDMSQSLVRGRADNGHYTL